MLGSVLKWVKSLLPDELDRILANEKGTTMDGVKNVFLSSFVPAFTVLVVFIILALLMGVAIGGLASALGSETGLAFGGIFGGTYLLIGVGAAVATVIFTPISFLIGTGIHWILAKILGGNGSYSDQAYYASHIVAGMNILSPVIMILSIIPCLGSIISIVAAVYPLFPYYKIVKKVHGFDTVKALIVILVPFVITVIIVIAIYVLYFMAMLGGGVFRGS